MHTLDPSVFDLNRDSLLVRMPLVIHAPPHFSASRELNF